MLILASRKQQIQMHFFVYTVKVNMNIQTGFTVTLEGLNVQAAAIKDPEQVYPVQRLRSLPARIQQCSFKLEAWEMKMIFMQE